MGLVSAVLWSEIYAFGTRRTGGSDQGISFSIKPGEVVAVVGSSGSGKTTISHILDRSYMGYEGSVMVAVRLSYFYRFLRKHIATVIRFSVSQSPSNVDLDQPSISLDKREEAVSLTHAKHLVEGLAKIMYSVNEADMV